MLSYCEKPYEGELLYGFALRMYRYNEEPESFRRFAFRNFGIGYGTGRGTKIPYDYVTDAERAAVENIRLRSFRIYGVWCLKCCRRGNPSVHAFFPSGQVYGSRPARRP